MKRRRKIPENHNLDPTSSLNKYFLCVCGIKYLSKGGLTLHIKKCDGKPKTLVCHWCNVEFKNRGNLAYHAFHIHRDKSYKLPTTTNKLNTCSACGAQFSHRWRLKFHIRRYHFNLWAQVPHYEVREVNQVWFEKVLNSNTVVEIKKTGLNTLVLKRTPPSSAIKINENRRIDLRDVYPISTNNGAVVFCKICNKTYRKLDFKKHMDEKHLNAIKHTCNNCNMTFKRSYAYIRHICHKERKRRPKRQDNKCQPVIDLVKKTAMDSIKITSVGSVRSIEID